MASEYLQVTIGTTTHSFQRSYAENNLLGRMEANIDYIRRWYPHIWDFSQDDESNIVIGDDGIEELDLATEPSLVLHNREILENMSDEVFCGFYLAFGNTDNVVPVFGVDNNLVHVPLR